MLLIKTLRDLRRNLLGTVTIILIASLGILFWSGFEGITINLERIVGGYYDTYAMPDLFVTGAGFTYSDIRALLKQPGVEAAAGRSVLDFEVEDLAHDSELRVYFQDVSTVLNKPLIMDGVLPAAGDGRSILMDYDYMEANGLSVGDVIRLRLDNAEFRFRISAAVRSPENIYLVKDAADLYPDHAEFGFAFVDPLVVWDLLYGGEENLYNQIVVAAQEDYLEAIKDYLTDKLGSRAVSITDRTGHFSANMIEQEATQLKSMVGVFPTVFFIIAALIAYTGIKRMVDKERTTIGAMKALGVKSAAIVAHYTSFGVLYGVLSCTLGIALGVYIPIWMLNLYEMYFALPPYTVALDFKTSALAASVAVVMCTLPALWAARKTLTLSPAVCMRPKAGKPGKKILLERMGFLWSRLGFIRRVMLRNMLRSKDRLLMCVFGMSASCALVFIAYGFQTSIDYLIDNVYEGVNSYHVQVFFESGATDAQKARILKQSGVQYGELIMDASAKASGESGVQKTVALTITPDTVYLLGIYDDRDRRLPLSEAGCIISDYLAGELGVEAGDTISLSFTGTRKTAEIKVNQVITLSFGQGIYLSQSAWRKAGEGFAPTSALLYLNGNTDQQALKEELEDYDFVLGATFLSESKANMESNMEMSNMAVYIMLLFAGLISFIVLFNLGILNFYEREREIATLKVMGFMNREVRKMAFGENYVFSVIGVLIGCPLGNLGLDLMLRMAVTEFYAFEKSVSYVNYTFSALTILLFACVTNLFLARYVKRIDLIATLKSQE